MTGKSKRVQISLHEFIYEDLKELATFQGKTLSEVVELGAITYLGIIVGTTEFRLSQKGQRFRCFQVGSMTLAETALRPLIKRPLPQHLAPSRKYAPARMPLQKGFRPEVSWKRF